MQVADGGVILHIYRLPSTSHRQRLWGKSSEKFFPPLFTGALQAVQGGDVLIAVPGVHETLIMAQGHITQR